MGRAGARGEIITMKRGVLQNKNNEDTGCQAPVDVFPLLTITPFLRLKTM
jgi:hypothetical protein